MSTILNKIYQYTILHRTKIKNTHNDAFFLIIFRYNKNHEIKSVPDNTYYRSLFVIINRYKKMPKISCNV